MTQVASDKAALHHLVEAVKFGIGDLKDHLQRREAYLDKLDTAEQGLLLVHGNLERLLKDVEGLQDLLAALKSAEEIELNNISTELQLFEKDITAEALKAGYTYHREPEPIPLFSATVVVPLKPSGGIA